MAKGGKRKGSGRKPGVSKVTQLKRTIQDYITEDEVKSLIDTAKEQAKEKPELMKFLLEQVFGKAAQTIEHSGNVNFTLEELFKNAKSN